MSPATPATVSSQSPASSKAFLWFAPDLLVVSVCINYIDRGNLSVQAPTSRSESTSTLNNWAKLYSAFFWTYALCLPFAGWLIDRFK